MLARVHTVEEIRSVVAKVAQRYGVQRVVLYEQRGDRKSVV